MIFVGIDVAKDKPDCFICNSDGKVLCKTFTFQNSMEGFSILFEEIKSGLPIPGSGYVTGAMTLFLFSY